VFKEFDTDDSGSIDRDELQAMMAKMGNPLSDEQVDVALKDLDQNGDGVVDFDEFAKWYFSGMRSYSKQTRALNQIHNYAQQLGGTLGDPSILEMVKENKSKMIEQKVAFAINTTPETSYGTEAKVRVNIFGREYEKYLAAVKAFASDIKKEEGSYRN
jgi:hypothetical protein